MVISLSAGLVFWGRGRCSFIPLKEIDANKRASEPHLSFPTLNKLIAAPEAFGPLVDALLADAVLVESLEIAIAEWNRNGKDMCYVTLDGDIVDQRGVISGGKLSQGSRGLLVRKREITDNRPWR